MNIKLTKLQRYTAYCIMLEERENYEDRVLCGLCFVICNTFGICNSGFYKNNLPYNQGISHVIEFFPELDKIWKEEYAEDFQNWDRRSAALNKCIEQTQ